MKVLRDNGLTLVLLGAFALSLVGMFLTGWQAHNSELVAHGAATTGPLDYLLGHDFNSALFENWESEFLQMAFFVTLSAFLFQRGSAESKDPDGPGSAEDDAPGNSPGETAPWPVRAGGFWLAIYSYSLGWALAALFALSFVLHWLHSTAAANEEALLHGEATMTAGQYLWSARLWFESFQNWQSEFLSTAVLVVLSIVLRFKGSAQSKSVAAPHGETPG